MTIQMIVRLDSEIKTKLTKLARAEGKNTSQVLRELIENYIRDRDMDTYVGDLWNRVGKKLKDRGIGSDDIDRAIHDVRASGK